MRNKYILMRHGETKYQAKGIEDILYTKEEQFSLPITQRAKKTIKETTRNLKGVDLIFSSDYYRTRQTAQIVAKELNLSIGFDKRLRDTDFGVFGGGPASKYKEYFSSKLQRFTKRIPKGESWRDVKKRAVDFLKEIDKKRKNKTILIISHADPLWLLAGFLKGYSEKELLKRRETDCVWLKTGQMLKI